MVLKVTKSKLRKELQEARQTLELRQERQRKLTWLEFEPIATCLHWLGQPEASEWFLRAAKSVRLTGEPEPHLRVGNYLRLAEDGEAHAHLERAYAMYREEYDRERPGGPWFKHMLESALLLGRDQDLQEIAQKKGRDYLDVRLARARFNGDPTLAAQVAEEYAENLRETRVRLSSSGSATSPWHFYEIALRTRAALEEGAPNLESTPLELAQWAAENPPPKPPPQKVRLTRDQAWDAIVEGMGRNESADLQNTDLSGLDLSEADLTNAVLMDADLSWADLSRADLIDANFRGANLKGVKLWGAEFEETDFEGADLSGTDLGGLDMRGTEMARANLQGANLSGANLSYVSFEEANLRNANLSGADLSHADLTGADLTGADLRGAKLEGADLEGAIMEGVLR